jgi:LacI family transcriptional regulator
VRIDKYKEGMIAFDLLHERLTEKRTEPAQIVLDVELIERESS